MHIFFCVLEIWSWTDRRSIRSTFVNSVNSAGLKQVASVVSLPTSEHLLFPMWTNATSCMHVPCIAPPHAQAYVRKHPYRALLRQKCIKDTCNKSMKKGLYVQKVEDRPLGYGMDKLTIKTPKQNVVIEKKLTWKGTLPQVFIRVCRLEIQSLLLVFSTQYVNCSPSNLLSGSPPLYSENILKNKDMFLQFTLLSNRSNIITGV